MNESCAYYFLTRRIENVSLENGKAFKEKVENIIFAFSQFHHIPFSGK